MCSHYQGSMCCRHLIHALNSNIYHRNWKVRLHTFILSYSEWLRGKKKTLEHENVIPMNSNSLCPLSSHLKNNKLYVHLIASLVKWNIRHKEREFSAGLSWRCCVTSKYKTYHTDCTRPSSALDPGTAKTVSASLESFHGQVPGGACQVCYGRVED